MLSVLIKKSDPAFIGWRMVTVAFFAGVQLLILGTVGEYLGRIFLDQSGTPQSVVRYTRERDPSRD